MKIGRLIGNGDTFV